MNKKTIFLIMAVISIGTLKAQQIGIGTSLRGLTNYISTETRVSRVDLGIWAENAVYIYEILPQYSLLISANFYPFGVLVKDDDPYYLLDITGDSVLDTRTNRLHVSPWVASINSKVANSETNIISIFNTWYDIFQNDEPPGDSQLTQNLAFEYVEAGSNLNYPNRDLLFLHSLYDSLYMLGEYQLCLIYLSFLDNELISRIQSGTHAIILIYLVETLFKMQDYIKASYANNFLLEGNPDCIPGLVYQVLLEDDPGTRNLLREALINSHGTHWLVRDKLIN